ncbi:MAG: Ig-like domain-containing protein [Gemmatimonas sp.]
MRIKFASEGPVPHSAPRGRAWVLVMIGLSLQVSCGRGPATTPTAPDEQIEPLPELTSMTVTVTPVSLQVGQSAAARVDAIDQKGRVMTVGITAWTSSQPLIATISADGIITARTSGSTTVSARVGLVQAQATVSVTPLPPGPVPVAMVLVSPSSASLRVAQSLQIVATLKDFASNSLVDREVSWTTSDATIATVSPLGVVTALAAGTAIIEATSETQRGAMSMSVTAAADTEIVVSIPTPISGAVVGDTMTVTATIQSRYPIVSVVASAGGQATVLAYGEISGVGPKGEGPPPMGWTANLDLSSLPFGPYALTITATDSRGHRGASAVAFVRNPRVPGGSKPPFGGK